MTGAKYKDNKPEMEKKRRSRINESLSCLKLLVLGEVRRKNTRISKLDKADILEMAVEYVKTMNMPSPVTVSRVDKYRAGFNACAEEVRKHLAQTPDVDIDVRTRIVDHLANFVQNLQWLRRHDILPYEFTSTGHETTSHHNFAVAGRQDEKQKTRATPDAVNTKSHFANRCAYASSSMEGHSKGNVTESVRTTCGTGAKYMSNSNIANSTRQGYPRNALVYNIPSVYNRNIDSNIDIHAAKQKECRGFYGHDLRQCVNHPAYNYKLTEHCGNLPKVITDRSANQNARQLNPGLPVAANGNQCREYDCARNSISGDMPVVSVRGVHENVQVNDGRNMDRAVDNAGVLDQQSVWRPW